MARALYFCQEDDYGQPLNFDDWTEPQGRGPPFVWCCDCNQTPFPAALLWAGFHLNHDEVQAKSYSENVFAVSLAGNQGLRPLEILSDTALRELRVLYISIFPCKCLTPYCQRPVTGHFHYRPERWGFWDSTQILVGNAPHSRPLCCISWTDKQTLSQWERICARLRANSRPHQLSLYLAANTADPQTAMRILDPLDDPLDGLPILKNFGHQSGTSSQGLSKV